MPRVLPYYEIPPLQLGPLKLYPFGVLVGCAIIAGTSLAAKRAQQFGIKPRAIEDAMWWAVIPGFIGAHLYSAIFYFPERIVANPWYTLMVWDGISSFGGFLGGPIGVIYYIYKKKLPFWV